MKEKTYLLHPPVLGYIHNVHLEYEQKMNKKLQKKSVIIYGEVHKIITDNIIEWVMSQKRSYLYFLHL